MIHSKFTYKGEFKNDKMQGFGVKTLEDGSKKEGYFFNNEMCLVDPAKTEKRPLSKEEAFQRSKDISDVSYKLFYALLRGGE